jgi:hypothetical protein
MEIGSGTLGTGTVSLIGGTLTTTNGATAVGSGNVGQMTVSNGTWQANTVIVAKYTGSRGTLSFAGGATTVDYELQVGRYCASTGFVNMAAGNVWVTNVTGTAVLDVRGGTFTQSGGSLVVDALIVTNSCGLLIKTGGTLSATTTNLAASLSAVGDGIPNSWKQLYGLDPFNPSVGSEDPDGDGFTNAQEFTNATNPLVNDQLQSWSFAGSGNWAESNRWATGFPPDLSKDVALITNAVTKTVTYDATTPAGNQVISNLVVAAPLGDTNTLHLNNAGLGVPLQVLNAATIQSGGAVLVTNSLLRTEDGLLAISGGSLSVLTNGVVATTGPVTITDGGQLNVTRGHFVITNTPGVIGAGVGVVVDGELTVSNGTLIATNSMSTIGNRGAGQVTMTGGLVQ